MHSQQSLSNVKKRTEQFGIKAGSRETRPFGQYADSIVAMQAFLMRGDNTEIPDTVIL